MRGESLPMSRLSVREEEITMRAWAVVVAVLSHPLAGSAEVLAFLHLAAWALCLLFNDSLLSEYRSLNFMHGLPQWAWTALTLGTATLEAAGFALSRRQHPDFQMMRRAAMFLAMLFFGFLGGSQLVRDPGFPPAYVYLATAAACFVAFLRVDELEREARDDASRGG